MLCSPLSPVAASLSSVASPPVEGEHQNTCGDIPVESYHRHDRYYLEDGVIFRVEHLHQIVTLSSTDQATYYHFIRSCTGTEYAVQGTSLFARE